MMPKLQLFFLVTALFCVSNAENGHEHDNEVTNPWTPQKKHFFQDYFLKRHDELLNETKSHADDIKLIFLGDSITEGWRTTGKEVFEKNFEKLGVYNYGCGADLTQNNLWRIQEGEFEGLTKLKAVFLMIGTNNLSTKDKPADVKKGIEEIVKQLKSRNIKRIYLTSVLPRSTADMDRKVMELNGLISELADHSSVHYINLTPFFETGLDRQIRNLYVDDLLHLSVAGYELWASRIKASVQEALK